ncbi:hypothetical protein Hanom_Chr10g00924981 [Helianthus anomalus]
MLTRRFWPPLSPLIPQPPILVFMESWRPISLIVLSALSLFMDLGIALGSCSSAEYRHFVFGWVGGKHACVDLTGVSSLVGLGGSAFAVGQAASGKVTKHDKACLDNQHVFISFAFDTFGFLSSEVVELLSRLQRVMHSNVMTPRSMYVVFKRHSFAIQKGVAVQLAARLPSISM